jgi:hypothetical protein
MASESLTGCNGSIIWAAVVSRVSMGVAPSRLVMAVDSGSQKINFQTPLHGCGGVLGLYWLLNEDII